MFKYIFLMGLSRCRNDLFKYLLSIKVSMIRDARYVCICIYIYMVVSQNKGPKIDPKIL